MSISHLLNRELDHYRTTAVRTPTGGLAEERALVGQVWARVPQPSATERIMARTQVGPQQGGAELTQPVYVEPQEDIRRGDELADAATGEVFRVKDAITPSKEGVYLRLDTEVVQAETVGEGA